MLIKYIKTPEHFIPKVRINDGKPEAYFVKKGGEPTGIIVALAKNKVGWSLCSKKDVFRRAMGKTIAIGRAEYYGTNKTQLLSEIPDSIRQEVLDMYERSEKYYK